MIASNIFKWIGTLFTEYLFTPFNEIRSDLALREFGWWISNGFNWLFLIVFLFLLRYWMKESYKFKREGTEDRA
ncbi:MAG: hypothetical protein P8P19_04035 [Polaribacter sp.]|jgi:glycopeptide antibiotics resistance protein|nr:hypothetical protein [Polaribacter sp.]MBT5645840.1 hypothetical protein [Polaribacter sp.]MBT7705485.1 hypothetical protein [Polaribacter sp.]MDB4010132.1 hypothetical protein [Polaribacter sp.]MDC1261122.1 hypothetical protein [Polaribacter sp.]